MFGFLYEMMGGAHGTLPARRRRDVASFDRELGTFVVDDVSTETAERWLGRGEVPGAVRDDASTSEGRAVADEMRELAQTPRAVSSLSPVAAAAPPRSTPSR